MVDIIVNVLICLGFALYVFVIVCSLSTKIGKIKIAAMAAAGLGLLGMYLSFYMEFAIFADKPEPFDVQIGNLLYSFEPKYCGDPTLFKISFGLCMFAAVVLFVMSLHTIITCRRTMFPFLFRTSGD